MFAPVRAKQLRILMCLLPERHEVRATNHVFDVRWTAGRPAVAVRALGGQVREVGFDVPPFVERTAQGRQIRLRSSTADLRDLLRDAVTSPGLDVARLSRCDRLASA